MKRLSLGMIETWGFVPAIEAADAGAKAANVTFLGYEITKVALVTVKFAGDVAAVTAAVTAGSTAAEKVGKVVAVHVIPRPDRQLRIVPPDQPAPLNKEKQSREPPPVVPPPEAEETAEEKPPETLPDTGKDAGVETPPQELPAEEDAPPARPPVRRKRKTEPGKTKARGKSKKA